MALTADDRLDIHEVLVRYGFVVDDRDWAGFARVFTPDAIIDFAGLAPIVGIEGIVRQYRDVVVRTVDGWRIKHKSMTSFGGAASPWLAGNRRRMQERGASLL